MSSEISQAIVGPGASTQSAAPTKTASFGSSNLPGWRISRSALPAPSATSVGGGGKNEKVEVGAGVGAAVALALLAVFLVLLQRRSVRREFARRTKAMREMRSANFAPDILDSDKV